MTRSNNFDGLRLIGALAVVVGHAFHLTGRPDFVPFVLGYPIATLGVVVFFSISGFLITASWQRSPKPVNYFLARSLRIFPGLIVVILASVFVLGPLVTTLTVGDYFRAPGTWDYLSNIRLQPNYQLPGIFESIPYPSAVNGSLWTLPAEFLCYLVVPLALLAPRLARVWVVFGLLGVSLYLGSIAPEQSAVVYGTRISDAAGMWAFFAGGALLRLAFQRRDNIFRTDVAAVAIAVHLLVMALWPQWLYWVSWATLPYVVLAIGLASTPYLRRAARYGDFSYGLYLWSFPVQQVVVLAFGVLPMSANLLVVTPIALALAAVSWYVVENPAMQLKKRLTGRRDPRVATVGQRA